jgi:hypothetical protein
MGTARSDARAAWPPRRDDTHVSGRGPNGFDTLGGGCPPFETNITSCFEWSSLLPPCKWTPPVGLQPIGGGLGRRLENHPSMYREAASLLCGGTSARHDWAAAGSLSTWRSLFAMGTWLTVGLRLGGKAMQAWRCSNTMIRPVCAAHACTRTICTHVRVGADACVLVCM